MKNAAGPVKKREDRGIISAEIEGVPVPPLPQRAGRGGDKRLSPGA